MTIRLRLIGHTIDPGQRYQHLLRECAVHHRQRLHQDRPIFVVGVLRQRHGDVAAPIGKFFVNFAEIIIGPRIVRTGQHGHDADRQFSRGLPFDAVHLFVERDNLIDGFRRHFGRQLGNYGQS